MELNTGIITDKKLNIGQLYNNNNITGLQQLVDERNLGEFRELIRVQPADIIESDYFGTAVACNDNVIMASSIGDDNFGTYTGSVYLFDINGNELKKILASDAQEMDQFGFSLAASDNRLVIATPWEDTVALSAGAAYIFDLNGNEIKKITAYDGQLNDNFGDVIACSNNRVVVGAYAEDTGGERTGAVYIFDINGNFLRKIQASDLDLYDEFGYSVACNDTRIVVGAPAEDTGGSVAGQVYIFDIDGNELRIIRPISNEAGDQFGTSVACNDTRIVVGAQGVNGGGGAYIFDLDGNEIAKMVGSDVQPDDYFGQKIACNNNHIIISAQGDDDGGDSAGAVYIFDLDGNELQKIVASNAGAADMFGGSIGISNTRIVVGADVEDTTAQSAGSTYIFEQKLLPSTTSIVAGTQPSSVTYANVIDEVYKLS